MEQKNILIEVENLLKQETTKISKQALKELDEERILAIILNPGSNHFWFESLIYSPAPLTNAVYDYLNRFIKRKLGYTQLNDCV
ncbi:hypothetical protein QP168_09100 [Aerococcus urinae]|uniref:Uncharacterized protein n=1 Tax=Aerococcus mictus TaxID=2976810 RepID=A0A1E9PPN2_9LACT|nr:MULTISPECIES: hypothetical protein [Aerococcus]KAA9290015.1 hypothetical protein F6I06_09110 [Aerococcus mictus]MBU5611224.1 hypothetical protein [Aerococcus urinae]MCY3064959.1 hypothetical protein [Aerococcus mictus]MCY3076210.1 hypothetical protein [Aerococcus mictus]MCY3085037.1 hypothetical protein [Aerococcus mictus]